MALPKQNRRSDNHTIKESSFFAPKISQSTNVDWQSAIHQFEQIANKEAREKDMCLEQIRQAEERNASLTRQFNELHLHCELVYQEGEAKRKEVEGEVLSLLAKIKQLEVEISGQHTRTEQFEQDTQKILHKLSRKDAEVADAQNRYLELNQRYQRSLNERATSLSSLRRGSGFIQSAVDSLADLFSSFQTYLNSVEKHGVTPITQRTGKMFLENWNLQRDNLVRLSAMLAELMEASTKIQTESLARDQNFSVNTTHPFQEKNSDANFDLDNTNAYNA